MNQSNIMKHNTNKYNFFRIASCSPKLEVANPRFNSKEIIDNIDKASQKNCDIILFPELAISSYSAADLFNSSELINSCLDSLSIILDKTKTFEIISIIGMPLKLNNVLYNCGLVCYRGEILGITPKSYLCNYNEYYENRWFTSGINIKNHFIEIFGNTIAFGTDLIFDIKNTELNFAIEICEDLWSVSPPSNEYTLNGANVILNLSGSDEYLGKYEYRKQLLSSTSSRQINAYIYASVGPSESSTDITYSGFCGIFENGKLLKESKRFSFESEMIVADLDMELISNTRQNNKTFCSSINFNKKLIKIEHPLKNNNGEYRFVHQFPFLPNKSKEDDFYEELFSIQSTALAKRLLHINAKQVVIGISGGLDSTLALFAIIETFKKLNLDIKGIHAITMPGFGTSDHTKSNAIKLMDKLGVSTYEIPIRDSVELHLKDIDYNGNKDDIVFENAQARERTQILMDFANKVNGIVIGTGDLSELALGWCTYNADQMSMYNVNSGIPKTLIPSLLNWYSFQSNEVDISEIVNSIIKTPISPELLPTVEGESKQKTEETIGKYILHDFYLYYFVRLGFGIKKIFHLSTLAFQNNFSNKELIDTLEIFIKRFFANQFKRSSMPDGPKIGTVSLSPRGDWRMSSDTSPEIWLNELKELRKEQK